LKEFLVKKLAKEASKTLTGREEVETAVRRRDGSPDGYSRSTVGIS
jgi:hypothetical protein